MTGSFFLISFDGGGKYLFPIVFLVCPFVSPLEDFELGWVGSMPCGPIELHHMCTVSSNQSEIHLNEWQQQQWRKERRKREKK
jgi:hypothetical protein